MALKRLNVIHDCPVYATTPPDVIPAGHVSSPYLKTDGTLNAKSSTGESQLPMAIYQRYEDEALSKDVTTISTWESVYQWVLPATTPSNDYFLAQGFLFTHTQTHGRFQTRTVLTGANSLTIQAEHGIGYPIEYEAVVGNKVSWALMSCIALASAGATTIDVQVMNDNAGTLNISVLTLFLYAVQKWN